jgi:hypothetical protein
MELLYIKKFSLLKVLALINGFESHNKYLKQHGSLLLFCEQLDLFDLLHCRKALILFEEHRGLALGKGLR